MQPKISLRLVSAFTFVIFACAAEVQAEVIYRIPGDFGWKRSVPLQLINDKAVVEDLGLSEEAIQKLKSLHEQVEREVEGERRKNGGQINSSRDKMVQLYLWNEEIIHDVRNRHRKELDELLTSQQQDRLHQIHLHYNRRPNIGRQHSQAPSDILSDSSVAQELGLSGSQRNQIYMIHRAYVKAEMDEIKGHRGEPSSATLKSAAPEKVMKILTDEQRQAFERLKGKPLGKTEVK